MASPRRRRCVIVAGGTALALGVLFGLAALRLARSGDDLRQAQRLTDTAAAAVQEGRLSDARSALDRASVLAVGANNDLYSALELQLVGWLPIAGENLESLKDSVGLAVTIIDGGRRILDAAQPFQSGDGRLEVSLSNGSVSLPALSKVQGEMSALSVVLPAAPPNRAPRFLIPQARELRTAVYDESAERRAQLDVLSRGLSLLSDLAGGSGFRRYLIAVANTSEMRGSGGMILNYGVLEGRDGTIDLTAFGRIDELPLGGPVASDVVPSDYLARWSGFDPLSRWRQANLAGDFTVVAPVLEAMYTSSTGLPLDGVIQIDPTGLSALLDGVGPVVVPELGEVRGDNVVALTMNEAYIRFPSIDERSDVLGDVAEAAFRRLVNGDVPSLRVLATRLAQTVDGRHLLMHATNSAAQAALASFGADGAYPPVDSSESIALTVQNLAGNKLDYYLDTDLQLTGARPVGEPGVMEARVSLTNTAPRGARDPQYIFGPGPTESRLGAGIERALVTLYLPLGTSVDGVAGDHTLEPVSSGTEAGRPYAAFIVDVPAGEARSVTLSLRLAPRPDDPYLLDLIPSPRVRPTTVMVGIATEVGDITGEVELDRHWRFTPRKDPEPVVAPTFR